MSETEQTCPQCSHEWDPGESPYLKGEELVEAARELAQEVHQGHVRKFGGDKGQDYFDTHLRRVYKKVAFFFPNDYEAQAVAWLHDSLEDFPNRITVSRLKGLWFPPSVIDAIVAITRLASTTYLDYLRAAFLNETSRIVKWYDMLDNGSEGAAKYELSVELFKLWDQCLHLANESHSIPSSAKFIKEKKPAGVGDYGRPTPEQKEVSSA